MTVGKIYIYRCMFENASNFTRWKWKGFGTRISGRIRRKIRCSRLLNGHIYLVPDKFYIEFITQNKWHCFLVETSRHKKIPQQQRLCTLCSSVDDEFHFFLQYHSNILKPCKILVIIPRSVSNHPYRNLTLFALL